MQHDKDSNCNLNQDDVCRDCGVYHGDECPNCGQRGYHAPDCVTNTPACRELQASNRGYSYTGKEKGMNTKVSFPLGRLVWTRGVNELVAENRLFAGFVLNSLARHRQGDWGNLGEEDKQENELSLKEGFRLLSAYEAEGLPKIWIITEADRSATTVLFPEEY